MAQPPEQLLRVTVVGDNARTIESLQRYLLSVGVESRVMRQLPDSASVSALGDAVVIFPDEFTPKVVRAVVMKMQLSRPDLRLLLVTSAPQHFQDLSVNDARPPILLPKPAFGWSILDAIRASAETREEIF